MGPGSLPSTPHISAPRPITIGHAGWSPDYKSAKPDLKGARLVVAGDDDTELKALCRELLGILEQEEESDSGRPFHPTHIHSCRALVTKRLGEILPRIKQLSAIDVDGDPVDHRTYVREPGDPRPSMGPACLKCGDVTYLEASDQGGPRYELRCGDCELVWEPEVRYIRVVHRKEGE